ncbi:hypothetical protein [Sphingomonas sp. PAMC 26621]|uniref:hypothetical protein n=1 Tax=Sphingomonas sp. PAMC 26621 TaxID=1112213 RepID=UPI0002FEE4DF|nr:hypothetical protein [Sphingomonas sp. PAMC 26621]
MIWIVLVAIVVGLILGRLMGFMAVEFLIRPVAFVARWGAALFVAIAGWGRRLP